MYYIFLLFLFGAEGNKRSTKRGYGLLEKVNEIIEGGYAYSTVKPIKP